MNHSTHLSKGSVWPRKYGILGISTQIAIGATTFLPPISQTTVQRDRYGLPWVQRNHLLNLLDILCIVARLLSRYAAIHPISYLPAIRSLAGKSRDTVTF